jgi:hypothetical protein
LLELSAANILNLAIYHVKILLTLPAINTFTTSNIQILGIFAETVATIKIITPHSVRIKLKKGGWINKNNPQTKNTMKLTASVSGIAHTPM